MSNWIWVSLLGVSLILNGVCDLMQTANLRKLEKQVAELQQSAKS